MSGLLMRQRCGKKARETGNMSGFQNKNFSCTIKQKLYIIVFHI